VYMAVFTRLKRACRLIYTHDAVSVCIYPALCSPGLLQGLNIATPKPLLIKPIKVIAAVINIAILCYLCCCCYRASAIVAALGGRGQ
jgi:hypothetical protein